MINFKVVPKNIGTGAVGTQVSVTGAGFTPKVVIAIANRRVGAVDAQGQQDSQRSMGFACLNPGSVVAQRVVSSFSKNGAASSTAINEFQLQRSDALIVNHRDQIGGFDGKAGFVAFTSDGCTLTILDQFEADLRVLFLFIGGDDITNTAILNIVCPTTGTTPLNQDITGLGFNPVTGQAAGLLLQGSHTTDNDSSNDSDLVIGAFVRASEQGVLMSGSDNSTGALNSQSISVCQDDYCMVESNAAVTATRRRIKFVQWIANGVRFQHDEIAAAEATLAYMLVINGGAWAMKSFNTPATETDLVLTGFGVGTPVGGIVCSAMQPETAVDAVGADQGWTVGFFDSPTSRASLAQFQKDNVTPTAVADAIQHDEVLTKISQAGAIQALVDINAIASDSITMHMDTADVSFFGWMLVAGSAVGGPPPPGPVGPLGFNLIIPISVEADQDLFLGINSRGHSAADESVAVRDVDITGNTWLKILETPDKVGSIWWKRATGLTGGKLLLISGGFDSMSGGLGVWRLGRDGAPYTDRLALFRGTTKTAPGFIPASTDSEVVLFVMSDNDVPITNMQATNPAVLPKRFESVSPIGSDCALAVFSGAQDGGPGASGDFAWEQAACNCWVLMFSIMPVLGAAAGWTTTTFVDSAVQQTAERPLFGTILGLTYTLDPGVPLLGGFWLSKVYGKDFELITIDRVRLEASAEVESSVGVSYTFDGGLTYSSEVIVLIHPASRGLFSGFGWQVNTGHKFQIRLRPLTGNPTIHKIVLYAQPRGPAQ